MKYLYTFFGIQCIRKFKIFVFVLKMRSFILGLPTISWEVNLLFHGILIRVLWEQNMRYLGLMVSGCENRPDQIFQNFYQYWQWKQLRDTDFNFLLQDTDFNSLLTYYSYPLVHLCYDTGYLWYSLKENVLCLLHVFKSISPIISIIEFQNLLSFGNSQRFVAFGHKKPKL